MRLDILYKMEGDIILNEIDFHKCILATIPYFENVFKYQDDVEIEFSKECTLLFKKWLYEQEINKDELNVEIGIEIKDLSNFLDITFYLDIKNKLFVHVLESPEEQFRYFKEFSTYDKRFKFTSYQVSSLDKKSFHYAYCLQHGVGCDKDEKKAYELYKQNWEENKDISSLNNYAFCLLDGIGCPKDKRKAFELFKQIWEENKLIDSLNSYAYCLQHGVGCDKDEKKAYELYKQNWEENKDISSLNNYAFCLLDGIGCPKDKRKACELYKQNWEENKHINSLSNYAYCLRKVIGCSKEERKAVELFELFNSLKKYL